MFKFGLSPPLELSILVFCLLFAIAVDLQALNRLRLNYLTKFATAKEVEKVEETLKTIIIKIAEAIVVKATETIIIKTAVETAVKMEKIKIKTTIIEAQFLYSKEIEEANLANLEKIQLLHLTM